MAHMALKLILALFIRFTRITSCVISFITKTVKSDAKISFIAQATLHFKRLRINGRRSMQNILTEKGCFPVHLLKVSVVFPLAGTAIV